MMTDSPTLRAPILRLTADAQQCNLVGRINSYPYERRAWPRVQVTQSATLRREEALYTLPARLCDQSPEGLGFTCPVALYIGEILDVSFGTARGEQRWRMRVVHCECIDDDTFRCGAQRMEE